MQGQLSYQRSTGRASSPTYAIHAGTVVIPTRSTGRDSYCPAYAVPAGPAVLRYTVQAGPVVIPMQYRQGQLSYQCKSGRDSCPIRRLGVTFDAKVTFEKHLRSVSSAASDHEINPCKDFLMIQYELSFLY